MKIVWIMLNKWIVAMLLTFVLTLTAAADEVVAEESGFTQIDGEIAGALFRLVKPDEWNGDLVMLLHGYVFPNDPITLPPFGQEILFEELTAGLVERGYGVAYSSYRVNGYAVQEGTRDTRIAQAAFTARFGQPEDVYLAGFSMGTHIGQKLIERTPERYEGFLAVCAALGGSTLQQDYFADARVLFDYFYPGTLPGDVLTADLDFLNEVVPAVFTALLIDPLPSIEMAAVLDIEFTTDAELFDAIIFSLLGAGGGTLDMQAKAGGNPYDNTATVYSGSNDDVALNTGVGRFAADPAAVRYLRRNYDPLGRLPSTEVLQLHTTRDPVVQLQRHQPVIESLLAGTGNLDRYFVRAVDRYGHCAFDNAELLVNFEELVVWSETGVKPAP